MVHRRAVDRHAAGGAADGRAWRWGRAWYPRDALATDTAQFAAVTMECVLRIIRSLTTGTRRTVKRPPPRPDRERCIFPSPALSAHPCSRRRLRGSTCARLAPGACFSAICRWNRLGNCWCWPWRCPATGGEFQRFGERLAMAVGERADSLPKRRPGRGPWQAPGPRLSVYRRRTCSRSGL